MPNQPPLNPDALAQAKAAGVDCRINGGSTEDVAECAVEAYLAVAQPVVNSVEELDQLPHETVIRDSGGFVFENIAHPGEDPEWWSTTDFLSSTEVTLPARVLYRPEVNDA